jgi:fructose/tagatose bisphosphate aldolase
LHGGSGTPADQIHNAIRLPQGGISKVNIATDLELGLLAELGRKERLTDAGLRALPAADLARGQRAVQAVVAEKIKNFLMSDGHAQDY